LVPAQHLPDLFVLAVLLDGGGADDNDAPLR
jgi:hypothetical protein